MTDVDAFLRNYEMIRPGRFPSEKAQQTSVSLGSRSPHSLAGLSDSGAGASDTLLLPCLAFFNSDGSRSSLSLSLLMLSESVARVERRASVISGVWVLDVGQTLHFEEGRSIAARRGKGKRSLLYKEVQAVLSRWVIRGARKEYV